MSWTCEHEKCLRDNCKVCCYCYKPLVSEEEPKIEERNWLIQDCRQSCGNCAFWWGPNRQGYVCNIDEAGRYTEEEAKAQEASRDTDRAVPLELALKYAVRHVRTDTNDGVFSLKGSGDKVVSMLRKCVDALDNSDDYEDTLVKHEARALLAKLEAK